MLDYHIYRWKEQNNYVGEKLKHKVLILKVSCLTTVFRQKIVMYNEKSSVIVSKQKGDVISMLSSQPFHTKSHLDNNKETVHLSRQPKENVISASMKSLKLLHIKEIVY